MATDFIVHDKADTVGVVVVEDIQPNKELTGWIMETDETIRSKALDAVPLGHKIALDGHQERRHGAEVRSRRRAVPSPTVGKGRHVHVHNLKTKRW